MNDIQKIVYNDGMDDLEALYRAVLKQVILLENHKYTHPWQGVEDSGENLITALNRCEAVLLGFDDKVDDFYHIQGTPAGLSGSNGLPKA